MALTGLLYREGKLIDREGFEIVATPIGEPRSIYATESVIRELPTSLGSTHPSRVAGADERTWRAWVLENEANAYTLRRPDESYDLMKEVQIQGERA